MAQCSSLARRMCVSLTVAAFLAGCQAGEDRVSPIKSDEVVLFYPTFARQEEGGQSWRLSVHGSIYEPEGRSLSRAVFVRLLRETLGRDLSQEEARVLDGRVRLFLVDAERDKTIAVRLGEGVYEIGTSGADGHFRGEIALSAQQVTQLLPSGQPTEGWLEFAAVTRPGDRRAFGGRAQLIGETGLSIVSDIDDTIKISQVRERKELLANTFVRPFAAVPGMTELYQSLAEAKAVFHYVSASPWQLFLPLEQFCRESGFPAGTFHLKYVRFTDSTVFNLFGSQEDYKSGEIEGLLKAFPRRRFVLIGDTGEQDPEIFAALARKHGDRIVAIYVRNVTQEAPQGERLQRAFRDLPPAQWTLFDEPAGLREKVLALTK